MAGMLTYILLLLLPLLHLVQPHKIGLLLDAEDAAIAAAIRDVAQFALNGSDELEVQEYSTTYMSLLDALCAFLDNEAVAVVSASSSTLTAVEADVMSQFHVPYIAAVATNPYLRAVDRDYLLLMAPSDKYQSESIFELLKYFKWYEFSILASADDRGINGVSYLQYLATRDNNFDILDVQHFDVTKNVTMTDITEELQEIKSSLARVIVLNCGGDYAKLIFREANAMGLMNEDFVWIVSDSIAGDQEKISYDGSYPTYYEGILGTVPAYGQGTDSYNAFKDEYITEYGGSSSNLMMSSVLVADAIGIIQDTLSNLDGTDWDSSSSVSCSSTNTWAGGETLLKSITNNSVSGVSGPIGFNANGVALSTSYDIMNFKADSFQKVGSWSNSTRLEMGTEISFAGGKTTPPTGYGSTLTGFHLHVGIVQENPIAYLRDSCVNDTRPPDCWYGWNPDIIARLASDLNFTYEYMQPDDMKYGGLNTETKTWNGMMGDIIAKKTDFTMALSINTERSQYIEFTHSFFEDQASYTVLAPTTASSANAFFFLLPFEFSVWASIIAMILVLSLLMTLLSKLSPFGKYGRKLHAIQTCLCKDCVEKRELKMRQGRKYSEIKQFDCVVERVEEQDSLDEMSFYNSLFVVGGGFVGQGGETLPFAPSGRFLLFTWWLFVMILISMYTANLTAHLTLERSTISIASLTDLLDPSQDQYEWGVITDRNLESMMLNRDENHKQLVEEGIKLTNIQEGVDLVNKGGFVFIDESSVLNFNFMENCNVLQTDTGKFSNEWALGLQPHSPYKSLINNMFLLYREDGWFSDKYEEWYSSDASCPDAVGSDMQFDLAILSGLFYIFAIGVLSSFVLVLLETLYAAHLDSKAVPKGSFWNSLKLRLRFKRYEIMQEWFGFNGKQNVHDSYNGKRGWVDTEETEERKGSGEVWLQASTTA